MGFADWLGGRVEKKNIDYARKRLQETAARAASATYFNALASEMEADGFGLLQELEQVPPEALTEIIPPMEGNARRIAAVNPVAGNALALIADYGFLRMTGAIGENVNNRVLAREALTDYRAFFERMSAHIAAGGGLPGSKLTSELMNFVGEDDGGGM